MEKKNIKIKLIIIGLVIFITVVTFFTNQDGNKAKQVDTAPTITKAIDETNDQISYQGKEGVDALTLLQDIAEVKLGDSGLVTSINKREVDNSKKEFWAFYVNGEYAAVGPADYITIDSDQIEWKIETY